MSNCIACKAPLRHEGYRKGEPYACPYCGKEQPIDQEDAAALEHQAFTAETERLLQLRRFDQAKAHCRERAKLRPDDVDAWVGLLLCAHRVTELSELAQCDVPLSLRGDTAAQQILDLDEKLGDRLLELNDQMIANFRAKLRRRLRIGGAILAGLLAVAALISCVIPSLLLVRAEAQNRKGDYPKAFLLAKLVADDEVVFPVFLRDRAAGVMDDALLLALQDGTAFAAGEESFCVLEDGVVSAASGRAYTEDVFPGVTAEKIGVSGRTVYALGSDGWILSRDLNDPGGKPEPTGARDFRTNAIGSGVVLLNTAGHPTSCERFTRLQEVPDDATLLSRLLGKTKTVERAFPPAEQFSGDPEDLLIGQRYVIGVFSDHIEAVREAVGAQTSPLVSVPWDPEGAASLCCSDQYVFCVSEGRVLRYPESGSCYTDALTGVRAVAAEGSRSAILLSSGEYQSDSAFDQVIDRTGHLLPTRISIVISPYTARSFLIVQ